MNENPPIILYENSSHTAEAILLKKFALSEESKFLVAIQSILEQAPLRYMLTPNGYKMSVAMTNCGTQGWVSNRWGYCYTTHDPITSQPWPAMPPVFLAIAVQAAEKTGYSNFLPDACLINHYIPGAKLSLHQDKDEKDFNAPIVSISLGLPAIFFWGGKTRSHKIKRIPLCHGDIVVWGGESRLFYHGIMPVKAGYHPFMGECRVNLTFRKAG